jgi:hypothetical protein
VFANIASCKCLSTTKNGELKTIDCTTNLHLLTNPARNQEFYTSDSENYELQTGDWQKPLCVVATGGAIGAAVEIKDCADSDDGMKIHRNSSKLVHPSGLEVRRSENDTLVLAEVDDADDHLFEFHCAACAGDEDWSCTGPAPTPVPSPTPDPTPVGNTTTLAPDTTPVPSAGVQIQSTVSSLCIDLPGGDTSNGALLWTWDCYGGDTQQWSFQDGQLVYLPDTSKCMDLLGGDTTNGNRLGLWDCYQGDSQLWGFDEQWGTIYLASSTASDATKCAQIGGENKGDPLVIWDCTVEPQQVWTVGSATSVAVV